MGEVGQPACELEPRAAQREGSCAVPSARRASCRTVGSLRATCGRRGEPPTHAPIATAVLTHPCVISHPQPDPAGARVAVLRRALEQLHYIEGFFFESDASERTRSPSDSVRCV